MAGEPSLPQHFSCVNQHGSPTPPRLSTRRSPEEPTGIREQCRGPCCAPSRGRSAATPPGAPGRIPPGCGAAAAAPTGGLQTAVETRVEQAGQSHAGHDRAVTATGFPQPCPGPSSRTPLPSLPLLKCCYCLYHFAAFAYKKE